MEYVKQPKEIEDKSMKIIRPYLEGMDLRLRSTHEPFMLRGMLNMPNWSLRVRMPLPPVSTL